MKTDILIRSYRNDFKWLWHSLKSIHKYGKEFETLHLVVPESDVQLLAHLTAENVHGTVDQCDGYLAQQITKLHADTWCLSDYILHVDSDCIFYKDFSPTCFFKDNKPIMLREECSNSPWNAISEKTLGWYDSYEYMRRHPIIYPRWIYNEFRAWIMKKHSCSLEQWICQQQRNEFSEFNTLGQWAHKVYPEAFSWCHPSEVPEYCKQYWSWGGLQDDIIKDIETLLA
jgi:hypothetical protein